MPSFAIKSAPSVTLPSASACRHDVQFYFDDRFLIRSLTCFIEGAIASGSSVIIVATRAHRDSLRDELERSGIDLPALAQQGRYLALDAAQMLAQFTIDGSLDEQLFQERIGNLIACADATRRPDGEVAIFGEMVALLWQRGDAQAALQLEQFWNRLSAARSFRLLCAYPLEGFDREVHTDLFTRICSEHETVIPAEAYSDLVDDNERLRAVARLQQSEQVLKTETEERRKAQARAAEIQTRNERLTREIRQREAAEEDLRRFTRRLLTARDEEQRRIAAELHENTAQLLSALSLYFGVLNQEKASLNPRLASVVASSRSVSDSLLAEIRKLSHLLHPPTLDDMGLGSALEEYVEQFNSSSSAKVELEIAEHLGRFDRKLELAVFRIVEEALSNLYSDSAKSVATVRLSRSASALSIEIQNHQLNSAPESAARAETRIMGIQARVIEHGGTVQFTSGPSGTLISVTFPLPGPGAARQH